MKHNHAKAILLLLIVALFLSFFAAPSAAQDNVCTGQFIPVSPPLTELGSEEYVRLEGGPTGFNGGLYPGGSNTRPPAHEAAGVDIARQIRPLDVHGNTDPDGQIVMISIGMSNANSEFNGLISAAHKDPEVNPALKLINGAQGGRVADRWLEPDAETWREVNRRLDRANVTAQQVLVAWVKQVRTRGGDFPAKAELLQSDLETIARNLKMHYPNLKIAYFSSRTRSYTYWRGLSPEPTAFESGFSVKWMIEKQINGDPALNFDPEQGDVNAPYLSWGPYLWIDGLNERADGRVWTQEDLTRDCTHPSQQGNQKVVDMMMEFFKTDTTAISWFLAHPPRLETETRSAATASPTAVAPTAGVVQPTATAVVIEQIETNSPATAAVATFTPTRPPAPRTTTVTVTPASRLQEQPVTMPMVVAITALIAAGFLAWVVARRR